MNWSRRSSKELKFEHELFDLHSQFILGLFFTNGGLKNKTTSSIIIIKIKNFIGDVSYHDIL